MRRAVEHTPYADALESVVLYGSRARGDAELDSDYDILIILKRDCDWREQRDILYAVLPLATALDISLDVHCISANELDSVKGAQPFIINALTEGIEG